MTSPDRGPRIPPLPSEERVGEFRELLQLVAVPGSTGDVAADNVFTTLVRAPRLFKRWLALGGVLLAGTIPAREREILVLRTGWNCQAPYEWGQHVRVGLSAGLTREEIRRLGGARPDESWGAFDGALVRAADELHQRSEIEDRTWEVLASRYDTTQLIEVPMVVGFYHLVSMTLNALEVELDEGLEGLPT